MDGFIQEPEYRCQLQIYRARFTFNPMTFIEQLIRNRNNSYVSIRTHIGSIIFNFFKPLSYNQDISLGHQWFLLA